MGVITLANTTMERWVQNGSTGLAPFGSAPAGCFLCHSVELAAWLAKRFL